MDTVFTNCTMIDGLRGAPVKNAHIRVSSGRIIAIESGKDVLGATDANVVNLQGGYLLPGFFTTHVHLGDLWPHRESATETTADRAIRAERNAMDALYAGITSMRSLGENDFIDVALRNAIEREIVIGPTIIASGNALIAPDGHGSFMKRNLQVRGPDAIRTEVERQIKNGVDCIKLVTTAGETMDEHQSFGQMQFSTEEVCAAVEAAHAGNKLICTHTGTTEGVKQAVQAGVDCIEHGYVIDDEAVNLLVKHSVFLTPTLSVTHNEKFYERVNMPTEQRERFRKIRARHSDSFRRAYKAGVQITCGSDNNPTSFCTLSEIELMVEVGMSEADAIVAATSTSAKACGVSEDRGSVTVGKYADFVVLKGDPLNDISEIWNTQLVVKDGHVLQPDTAKHQAEYWDVLARSAARSAT